MKLCWFCPKCKCEKCIFHSIDENGNESCYWGYIEKVRSEYFGNINRTLKVI